MINFCVVGGMVITVFAAMHPDMVRHLVVLDVTAPFPKNPEGATQQARKHIDELLKNEEMSNKKKPKVYPLAGELKNLPQPINPHESNLAFLQVWSLTQFISVDFSL